MTNQRNPWGSNGNSNGNFLSNTHRETMAFLAFGLALAFLVFWNTAHVWVMMNNLHMNDFGKFYYASVAFLNDQDMYGPTLATLTQVSEVEWEEFWDLNPPHFHVLLLPFALMPESWSLLLWSLVNFLALLVTLTCIQQELKLEPSRNQKRLMIIGGLGFAGTGAHLVTGQLSFLIALPITLAWIHGRHARWAKASVLLGLTASIKPFLLIFLPYLLLKRQVKPMALFFSVFLAPFVVGVFVFGIDAHLSWVRCLTDVNWHWTRMNASIWGVLARTLGDNPMFTPPFRAEFLIMPLWGLFATIIGGCTLWVLVGDHSRCATDRAFAILLFSAILISPLGWIYYLFMLLGPLTALLTNWNMPSLKKQWLAYSVKHKGRTLLLTAGALGLLFPLMGIQLFQPNFLATLTLGSIYFWSTFMLWSSLVLDWAIENH